MTGDRRKMHVHLLDVAYPPGSLEPGWEPDGWRVELTYPPDDPLGGPPEEDDFHWPQVRPYLSASGAKRRADLLRKYGAEVTIRRSLPVEWPHDEAAAAVGRENSV